MTREEEYDMRRDLTELLKSLTPEQQLKFQDEAMANLSRLQHLNTSMGTEVHWEAHRFINIVAWRSFGRLDAPCQHRNEAGRVE